MSDLNLVIRMKNDRQPRLGIVVGCIMAMVFASADSTTAQVVQVAGEKPGQILGVSSQLVAGESGRFSSRRLLVQLPQTGEPSPSDVSPESDGTDDKKPSDEKQDDQKPEETSGSKDSNGTNDSGQGVTPTQSAELKLGVDRVNISMKTIGNGLLPDDIAAKRAKPSISLMDGQSRGIVAKNVNWMPANVCYLPLYFEDAMLERHGHVRWGCAQPLASGVRFLTTIPLLPYVTTLQPPCEPRYSLGHFRPGSCAPALKDHLPWDRRAAVVETVSLGAFFWAAPL